jgi:hypothetical protein
MPSLETRAASFPDAPRQANHFQMITIPEGILLECRALVPDITKVHRAYLDANPITETPGYVHSQGLEISLKADLLEVPPHTRLVITRETAASLRDQLTNLLQNDAN